MMLPCQTIWQQLVSLVHWSLSLGLQIAQTSVELIARSDWKVLNFTLKTPKLDLMTMQNKNPVFTPK